MMDMLKGKKKRIAAGVTAAALLAAAVFGIASAVRATTARTVPVVPVSDLNYGSYLDWENSVTGMITTQAEQNIYLSGTEKVEEVLVQEGQAVREGDVLLVYDTRSTELALEKEKVKKEKIELDIEVTKENIRTLENISAQSDGDGFGLVEDFAEVEAVDVLGKAAVHEKILTADARPVSEGSEFEILGTADAPYVFLCKGNGMVLSKDFIKKWQKRAAQNKMDQLYIELAAMDEAKKLQKAWITDIMLLDPAYDIEVDLRSGKAGYAAMNDPEQMSLLLRKILLDVPEDERGVWLAAMLDKLLILTEKEEKKEKRGELLAAMLRELGKDEQSDLAAEFAAAASLLDDKTRSFMLRCLVENMTPEQVKELDPEMLRLLFGMLTPEQLKILLQERGDEVRELLDQIKKEETAGQDQPGAGDGADPAGTGDSAGSGADGSGGAAGSSGDTEGSEGAAGGSEGGSGAAGQQDAGGEAGETQENPAEETPAPEETSSGKSAAEEAGQENASPEKTEDTGETMPSTASDTSGSEGGSRILSPDTSYTSDELEKARREARDRLRDLQLNLRESDLKIEKAQQALDQGVVTANMNGVVKAAADPAAPPTDGSAFITVAGTDGLFVKSGIKESRLGTLREGDRVTITSWQTGGQYEALIKSISPYPDSTGMFDDSGTETYYPFTANLVDKNAVLVNGEWVEVSYTASEGGSKGTMTVMKAFVREEGSKKYVFVRNEQGRLRKQYITTGTLSDSGYEVLDGLSESDWITFPYGKNVKEGAKTRESTLGELTR